MENPEIRIPPVDNVYTWPRSTSASETTLLQSIATTLAMPRRIVLPTSWVGHIPFATWLVPALRPSVIVELGVHTGNSFFTFAEAAAAARLPTVLYGIDTWEGDEHAGDYGEDVFLDVSAVARERFPDSVRLVRKRFEDAVADFADGSVDLLHIDGLHTYEAVRQDFETWQRKLSSRAVVLFHDVAVVQEGFGVTRFWHEVRSNHPHFEFSQSNGLGVLVVGPQAPDDLARLCRPSSDRDGALALFGRLGDMLLSALRHGPDVDALPVDSPLDPPRVYLAIDGAFTEASSVTARPLPDSPGALHCGFGPSQDGASLSIRIDPMENMGIRGIHRIIIASHDGRSVRAVKPVSGDIRQRVSILELDGGYVFVGTGNDSQWIPILDDEAREILGCGGSIVFEPMALSRASLTRLLLGSLDQLMAPLNARMHELAEIERSLGGDVVGRLGRTLAQADRILHDPEAAPAPSDVVAEAGPEGAGVASAGWAVQVDQLDATLAHLRARFAERIAAERVLDARLVSAVAETDAISAELAATRAWGHSMTAELSSARNAHRSMQTRFDSLRGEIERLRLAHDEALRQNDLHASRLVELLKELETRVTNPPASESGLDDLSRLVEQLLLEHPSEAAQRAITLAQRFIHTAQHERGKLIVAQKRQQGAGRRLSPNGARTLCLDPLRGLVPLDGSARRWRSIDLDPQFAFPELTACAGRWAEVSFKLHFTKPQRNHVVIYLDYGAGMSEVSTIVLPRQMSEGEATTFIFPVHPELKFARLDPCAFQAEFTFEIALRPLSKWQAPRQMYRALRGTDRLQRLRHDFLPRWRDLRKPRARRELKEAFVHAYRSTLYARSLSANYDEWISHFEVHPDAYGSLAETRSNWPRNPLISVLMPTFRTPPRLLREAIDSVIHQNYPHWELCIADDCSASPEVRQIIEQYVESDRRIKAAFRETNGHIAAASNSALELASGEFVALLDHDDALHPSALHYVAEAIVRNPSAHLIYSDEDKIDADGGRTAPCLKSDFNYELFLCQNMVSHLGSYRTDTVRAIGGFRVGLEGSQDWDLALRVLEHCGADSVIHIPRVLYHWRETPGSTAAAGGGAKPYAQEAGRRAIEQHLERRGSVATVVAAPEGPNWNRVRYAVPSPAPKVSIIVPTRDKVEVLKVCIDSLLHKTTYADFEILIVDNGSIERATAEYLDSLPVDRVKVIRDDSPFNYSRLNNQAAAVASGDLLCLLNNDTEVINADWLDEMVGVASQPGIGIVGARLWYPDMRIQHAGVVLGVGGVAGHVHRLLKRGEAGYFGRAVLQQDLSAVTGACLLITKAAWQAAGGLDETLEVAFNDVDLCMRVRHLGYRIIWTPYAELIHHESLSRGFEDSPEKLARFKSEEMLMTSRWGKALLNDPFYSPNLSLAPNDDFNLSWDPRIRF